MRIPDELLNCVVFLSVEIQGGPEAGKYQPFGTALFVGVDESDFNFSYLVTARHILDQAKDKGYINLFARVNKRDGSFDHIDLGSLSNWNYYTDRGEDLAILPFSVDPRIFECKAVPMQMLVTVDDIHLRSIDVGDELATVGLFTLHTGKSRNIPIVRSGNIAVMPHEPLLDDEGREYFAFLAEMRSIGGLSGSPVFLYLNKNRAYDPVIEQNWDIFLLGIIRGHWDLKKQLSDSYEIIDDIALGFSKGENMNVGIAIVTPASSILQMLHHHDVAKRRKELVIAHAQENQITEDRDPLE